jgi:hypothetical protein
MHQNNERLRVATVTAVVKQVFGKATAAAAAAATAALVMYL